VGDAVVRSRRWRFRCDDVEDDFLFGWRDARIMS
jgi:hypothetical protein